MMDFGQWAYIGPGFTATRARNSDPATSHEAAKNAATSRAAKQRIAIREALQKAPQTCKELAVSTGIDYHAAGKRLSEVNAVATGEVRNGCRVMRLSA